MTQSHVLILQHVPWEKPGRILDSLDDLGMSYEVMNIAKEKKPDLPDFSDVSGIVIMGAPWARSTPTSIPVSKRNPTRTRRRQRRQTVAGRVPRTSDHCHRAGRETQEGQRAGNRIRAD